MILAPPPGPDVNIHRDIPHLRPTNTLHPAARANSLIVAKTGPGQVCGLSRSVSRRWRAAP